MFSSSMPSPEKTAKSPPRRLRHIKLTSPGAESGPVNIIVLGEQCAAKLNTLRFMAISSVVWGHTLFGWDSQHFTTPMASMVQVAFLQLGRMGTIPFFIISGFFLADRLPVFTVGSYLKYRWQSVILPWLFFVSLCAVLQSFQIFLKTGRMPMPGKLLVAAIFHAAYWFIPVSLFAACLLIAAKKHIHTAWFALLLVSCTLFYCINLYYHWIAVNHTKSILGYTLFTWLGIWLKKNISMVDKSLRRIGWPVLSIVLFVMFGVSCGEALYLKNIGCGDAFASIRTSNILLSLLLCMAFLKRGSSGRITQLQPQKYVYGVYLIHSIVLLELLPLLQPYLQNFSVFKDFPFAILVQVLAFVTVLGLSYFAAVLLKKSKLHRLVGR